MQRGMHYKTVLKIRNYFGNFNSHNYKDNHYFCSSLERNKFVNGIVVS